MTPRLRADLCVVGLGAAGLRAAAEAARRGLDVVGVDAGRPGDGASGRNGGFLLAGAADFHHVLARRIGAAGATALYRRTLEGLEEEISLAPDAVRRTGSLRLAVDAAETADCREMAAAMRRDGIAVEDAAGPWGRGLRFPHDAAMHPGRRCAALVQRAEDAGVRLVAHAPARRIDAGAVVTDRVRISAPRTLVAIDGGLELVLPQLAADVRTGRAQMLATGPDAVPAAVVPAPVYARHGYDYWQRLPDGTLALGGGRDLGGDREWTADDAVTAVVQGYLERVLRERIGTRAPVVHRWSGRLGFTRDRMPVCRLLAPDLAVAGGYCGTGNVIGPIAAIGALRLLLDGQSADAALLTG
jgi:gamma-glutamylputrescine oxidase